MIYGTVVIFGYLNKLKLKFPQKSVGKIHPKFCTLDTIEIQHKKAWILRLFNLKNHFTKPW